MVNNNKFYFFFSWNLQIVSPIHIIKENLNSDYENRMQDKPKYLTHLDIDFKDSTKMSYL